MDSWRRSCEHDKLSCSGSSGQMKVKRGVTVPQEAAFEVWWRERRSHAVGPMDLAAPTAAESREAELNAEVMTESQSL